VTQIFSPRDVLMFDSGPGGVLVSAVDSCGGIGNLPGDVLRADPRIVGEYTARVALMEVLATGAHPLFATAAISSGPQTAFFLIEGIKKTLGEAFPLSMSTEKNMDTSMTALGVTVTGFCASPNLRIARAQKGDILYCAFVPSVGAETLREGALLLNQKSLLQLLQDETVHSLLPVGSKGVAAEAKILADESSLVCVFDPSPPVDLHKSAGPATCAVLAASGPILKSGLPLFKIGLLK